MVNRTVWSGRGSLARRAFFSLLEDPDPILEREMVTVSEVSGMASSECGSRSSRHLAPGSEKSE